MCSSSTCPVNPSPAWSSSRGTSASKTTIELQPVIQQQVAAIAGARIAAFQMPPLPGSQGLPVQFVVTSTEPFDRLNVVAQEMLQEANRSGMFIFLDTDLKIDNPQSTVEIDRNKAAQLGLKMSDVGSALTAMLGGGYVNYFSLDQRSYKVIPQVQQRSRLNAQQLLDYYIASVNGVPVPLSTIARITTKVVPESLNHFQQLNSATLQGVVMPGVAQADALNYLKGLAAKKLPLGYSVDYGGLSRQYVQESSGFVLTFGFALIVIYLSLAALFESFRDPLIILVSVPMSIAGAMIFISVGVGGATLNIYTQVGLVTLMGLISKHGILIVEFANDLRRRGLSKREAIEQAAAIRLRPILMTTAAMVLGVIPLIIASGAGAVSRFNMGLVIASGLSIGTLFTLFVLPAVYLLIAAGGSRESMASDLDAPHRATRGRLGATARATRLASTEPLRARRWPLAILAAAAAYPLPASLSGSASSRRDRFGIRSVSDPTRKRTAPFPASSRARQAAPSRENFRAAASRLVESSTTSVARNSGCAALISAAEFNACCRDSAWPPSPLRIITERLIPASCNFSSASRVVAKVSPLLTRASTSSSPDSAPT